MGYIIYGHGGSRNHGCEALIRTTLGLIGGDRETKVYTSDIAGDIRYGTADLADFRPYGDPKASFISHVNYIANIKLFRNYDPMTRLEFKDLLDVKDEVFISIGGDNYCNGHPGKHVSRNKIFSKKNATVLWGCSITPELMKEQFMVDDMNRYSLITARESMTRDAIVDAGVKTRVELVPDPAFLLEKSETDLPEEGFIDGNTVGINVSPLVMGHEKEQGMLLSSICALVDSILENSDMNVAFIPHVIWKSSDDLKPLTYLYERYGATGRVCLVDPEKTLNCMQLKYVISRCRFMVCARTHASIAAYSTCVPTLVLGYSVKSLGIARDLFGTHENYVLPVDSIIDRDMVKDAFDWLRANETSVRSHLKSMMPDYIGRAEEAGRLIAEL